MRVKTKTAAKYCGIYYEFLVVAACVECIKLYNSGAVCKRTRRAFTLGGRVA